MSTQNMKPFKFNRKIATKLKELVKKNSQTEVANVLDITQSPYNKIESGKTTTDIKH